DLRVWAAARRAGCVASAALVEAARKETAERQGIDRCELTDEPVCRRLTCNNLARPIRFTSTSPFAGTSGSVRGMCWWAAPVPPDPIRRADRSRGPGPLRRPSAPRRPRAVESRAVARRSATHGAARAARPTPTLPADRAPLSVEGDVAGRRQGGRRAPAAAGRF